MGYFGIENRFFCFLALSLESVNHAFVTLEEDGERLEGKSFLFQKSFIEKGINCGKVVPYFSCNVYFDGIGK
jgi:hypothetical protein